MFENSSLNLAVLRCRYANRVRQRVRITEYVRSKLFPGAPNGHRINEFASHIQIPKSRLSNSSIKLSRRIQRQPLIIPSRYRIVKPIVPTFLRLTNPTRQLPSPRRPIHSRRLSQLSRQPAFSASSHSTQLSVESKPLRSQRFQLAPQAILIASSTRLHPLSRLAPTLSDTSRVPLSPAAMRRVGIEPTT